MKKKKDILNIKECGFTPEEIEEDKSEATKQFMAVNDIMKKYNRPPLFDNPSDTYESAKRYLELLNKRTKEQLVEIFGCSWDDYEPPELGREGIAIDD